MRPLYESEEDRRNEENIAGDFIDVVGKREIVPIKLSIKYEIDYALVHRYTNKVVCWAEINNGRTLLERIRHT